MKRTSVVTWVIVLAAVIIPLCAGAATPIAPHTGFPTPCNNCHTVNPLGPAYLGSASQSSPAYYNNVCQSCHRPGDANAGSKPLSNTDASVVFGGHTTNNAGTSRMQTSHRWDGALNNQAAGAQPPIQAAMSTRTQGTSLNISGRTGNQLACVRCHSVHMTANAKSLRMPNDKDQMCMDCHTPRNKQSHLSGTHPVGDPINGGVNYSTIAAANPSKFKASPSNSNPANPTSDLGTKLSSTGNVVCSTCHGVHYTDSRSSTFDGFSSPKGRNNYANLSSGDGYILRTDRRGGKVSASDTFDSKDNLNICTNCHANKKSHNAANQDVQCNDCHGAHVEYDKDDPNKLIAPNVYLVRRDVSKAGVSGKVYFRYTGSQREYKNSQGTGVCQGCHDVPAAGGKYPPEHDRAKASECNGCHYHGSQAGSFSGACGKCHGNPPTVATIGGPSGLASPATGALAGAVGAHDKHVNILKMNCNVCHNRYANKEMPSTTIDLEFAINPGTYPGFKGVANTGNYNTPAPTGGYSFSGPVTVNAGATRTCSTVYCHGGTLKGGYNSQPSWTGDLSEASCGACHDISNLSNLDSSHPAHATASLPFGCDSCHPAVADATHMQGSLQWDLSGIGGAAQYKPAGGTAAQFGETGRTAPSTTYGVCSNISCHGQGAPTWGATAAIPVNGFPYSAAQCGKCHSQSGDVTAVKPFYSTAIPKVTANTDAKAGAHTAHIASTDNLSVNLTCNECHGTVAALNSAGHMNGSTDFVWGDLATGKQNNIANPGFARVTPTYLNGTCSSTYCHGATMTGGTNKNPSWNSASYLPSTISAAACGTCHGFPPPGHNFTAPTTFPAAAVSCNCHPNINTAGTSYADIFVLKSKHIDGLVEGGGCNGCHGYPPSNPALVPGFSAGNYEFAKAESYLGSGGAHTVAGHVSPTANASEAWVNCTPCHKESDHVTSPKVFLPSSNIKVTINPRDRFSENRTAKYTSNNLDGALHVPGNCSNVACHFQKSPSW